MFTKRLYSQLQQLSELGERKELTQELNQKTYIYKVFSSAGFAIHFVFLIINLILHNYWLVLFNCIQMVLAVTILVITIRKKGLSLRIWLVLISTIAIICGALFFNNGNEYILFPYLIGTVILFNRNWQYLLYAIFVVASFSYIKIKQNHSNTFSSIDSTRSFANMVVALALLTMSVYFLKYFYAKFRGKLEKAEEEIRKSARLYEFLSSANDLIIHAKNQDEIYAEICKMAIHTGGFRFALIVKIQEPGNNLTPHTWAGFEDGYLSVFNNIVNHHQSPLQVSPSHNVIQTGAYYYSNDISKDPLTAAWRNEALKRGYHSFINLPLHVAGKVSALFILYSYKPNFFNASELKMLVRVADNISLALNAFVAEAINRATQIQLGKVTQAVEQSSASVVITDLEGNIEYVNSAFTKVTGYSFNEAVGQNPKILKTGYSTEDDYKLMWNLLLRKEAWQGVFKNRKKNGELYWENASISPILNTEGAITNYVAVKEDITERKKLEDEQQQILKILDNTKAFVATISLDGYFTYINRELCETLEIPDLEISNYNISQFQDLSENANAVKENTIALLKENGKWTGESIYQSLTGKTVTVLQVMVLHQNENSPGKYISITAIDITKIKESEEKLKLLNADLRNLSSHLQEVSEQEKMEIARELHDELGQTLTLMSFDIRLLALHLDDKDKLNKGIVSLKEKLASLSGGFRRLLNALNTSTLRDFGLPMSIQSLVDAFALSTSIPIECQVQMEEGELDFKIALPLYRLIQESLTNIMRYAQATRVEINLEQNGKVLFLNIKDNGKGFEIEKVDTKVHHGLLGMRERIYAINGQLNIISRPGKGTAIAVEVPI